VSRQRVLTLRITRWRCADDGHGGAQTSCFLRENSYAEFEKQLEKTRDPKQAFEKAFEQLDKDYIDQCLQNPRKAGLFAGSCAVALYFDCVKNCLWVANLGDSRAVLGNVDETGWVETVEMTTDHRCDTLLNCSSSSSTDIDHPHLSAESYKTSLADVLHPRASFAAPVLVLSATA
jgi:serine/threonine protein phosphatase PrpC